MDKTLKERAQIADHAVILNRGQSVWTGRMEALTPDLTDQYLGVKGGTKGGAKHHPLRANGAHLGRAHAKVITLTLRMGAWHSTSAVKNEKDVPMPKAVLYRMDLPGYTCGFGTAARDLLRREKFEIEEHILRTRHETDAFKDKHHIATTPLVFIEGQKIGGFSELREHLKAQKVAAKQARNR